MADYTIYVRNADRQRVAQVDDFGELELTLRFNDVSDWRLTLPFDATAATHLNDWSAGLEVVRDGTTVLSGPVGFIDRRWSDAEDGLVVGGPDDTVWLARRMAYPEAPALTTATSAYDVRTGVAETIMRQYVDNNAGPSANSTRKVAGLTLAADGANGSSVTGRGRFHTLLELLQRIAVASSPELGFRVVQSGTDIQFQVYVPSDKTATAIFSEEFGNLAAFSYATEAPTANFVVVGGGGEGTSRTFRTGGDNDSIVKYGRIEAFRDRRDTTSTSELVQAGDEFLAENADKKDLSLQPIDTDAVAYGTSYGLGDKVTVMVDGVAIQDVVREIVLKFDGDGEAVAPHVGTPGSQQTEDSLLLLDQMREIARRVGNLERR